jgi:hypothetical protein
VQVWNLGRTARRTTQEKLPVIQKLPGRIYVNKDMSSSAQDRGTEKKMQQHQRHPGALSVNSSNAERKRKSLLVRKVVSLRDQPDTPGKAPTRNDSFIRNPTPPTYFSRRELRRKAAYGSSRSMLHESEQIVGVEDDDDECESMELPGAVPVPGIFSFSGQDIEINTHTRPYVTTPSSSYFFSAERSQAEAILAAQLVEDIEIQDRDKIRQEIYDEAEQAEVVDTKRQKKFFLLLTCLSFLILAGIGVGVGLILQPRQGELNNSVCANSAPLFIGDTISGSVGNSGVSKITTCSPTKPNGEVKGRWFTFLGDGTSMTASTCGNTNFDSQISIYIGSSCESLSCVAFSDNSPSCCSSPDWECNSTAAAISVATTLGVTYYICVHGTNVEADAMFELILSPSDETFANDSAGLL